MLFDSNSVFSRSIALFASDFSFFTFRCDTVYSVVFFISVNQLLESDKTVESGTVDNIKFDFRQIDLLSRIFVAENGNWFSHYKIAKFFVLYDILGSFLYRSPCIQPFFIYNFKNALINKWYKLIKILINLKKIKWLRSWKLLMVPLFSVSDPLSVKLTIF